MLEEHMSALKSIKEDMKKRKKKKAMDKYGMGETELTIMIEPMSGMTKEYSKKKKNKKESY